MKRHDSCSSDDAMHQPDALDELTHQMDQFYLLYGDDDLRKRLGISRARLNKEFERVKNQLEKTTAERAVRHQEVSRECS